MAGQVQRKKRNEPLRTAENVDLKNFFHFFKKRLAFFEMVSYNSQGDSLQGFSKRVNCGQLHNAELCNGSTADSDSVCEGSNPSSAAIEVWLSLVERYVRDVEAGGSNPLTSTSKKPSTICTRLFCVLIYRLYGAARLVICSDKRRFGRPKIERIRSRKVSIQSGHKNPFWLVNRKGVYSHNV